MTKLAISQSAVRWCWIAILVIILDQLSKAWIMHSLYLNQVIAVLPFFNLVHAHNTGSAFSFLAHAGNWAGWLFAGIAVIVSLVIITWLLQISKTKTWLAIALSLILGGALGNLIDRIHHGFVVDFIQIYYQQWYWPAFNIADSAITIGAVMLAIEVLFFNAKKEQSV